MSVRVLIFWGRSQEAGKRGASRPHLDNPYCISTQCGEGTENTHSGPCLAPHLFPLLSPIDPTRNPSVPHEQPQDEIMSGLLCGPK